MAKTSISPRTTLNAFYEIPSESLHIVCYESGQTWTQLEWLAEAHNSEAVIVFLFQL